MSKLENEVRIIVEEVLSSWIPEKRELYDDRIKELITEFSEYDLSDIVEHEVENAHISMGFSPKTLSDLEDRMKDYVELSIRVNCQSPEPVKIDRDSDEPIDVIWSALHHLRENVLGESKYANELWDEICHAMAIIGEGNEPEDGIYDSRDGWQCLYNICPVGYSGDTRESYCVVNVGDTLWLNGEEVKVTSLSPPHKPSSTGKIGCRFKPMRTGCEPSSREYFAGVLNCRYIYSPLKLPVEG